MAASHAGVWSGSGASPLHRLMHLQLNILFEGLPLVLGEPLRDQVFAEAWQRIPARLFLKLLLGAVGRLVVRPRVAAQPGDLQAQQGGARPSTDVADALAQQGRRRPGVGPIPVPDQKVAEGIQIPGDVAPRGLETATDRNAQPVVLDEEEHRQTERGGHGQSRPEAVGGHRGVAPQGHRQGSLPGRVSEGLLVVEDRLGPPHRRGELRAHIPGHGQHHRSRAGPVEGHAGVPASREPSRTGQGAGRGLLQIHPQSQHQGTAAIVDAGSIPRMAQGLGQEGLRDLMAFGRELIQHQVLAGDLAPSSIGRLLGFVQEAGGQTGAGDLAPVEGRLERHGGSSSKPRESP
jgi:hypothetical protein